MFQIVPAQWSWVLDLKPSFFELWELRFTWEKIFTAIIDRLINIALPRTKDYSGLSEKNFDGLGNYTFGIKEHIIFPEIDYDKIDKVKGMDVTIVTSTKKNNEAKSLLKAFNFPLNK